ncbi:single-stranded DNA-binding protein 1 [Streptomyces longispororuber]|uniref:Single-stranded DNA-binding protein n=1 Tax=Streptomyces longispororuber TaxID=68230 RepID=A0A919DP22_9ACTN|nr:single-stranded DNA-binding protein [Streptomyces longispororuber]GHE61969.1 single-stranded DNA-binding protein 1 [Streptomyces longispororuber]
MNDTMVTVVGRVATTPVFRELPSGPVTRFRIAVTPRHFDRTRNEWTDGHTNFFTVWARRTLGVNAQSSLSLGEQVIVQGRLKVKDEERGGQHWISVDIDAQAIGHDLARGTSAFRRGKALDHVPDQPRGQAAGEGQAPDGARKEPEPAWESPPDGGAEVTGARAGAETEATPDAGRGGRAQPAAVG